MSFHNDFLITQISVTWFSMRFMLLVTSKRNDYSTKPQRSSLLQCYRSCRYKGLEKGLAGRASKSKSKSIAFESKSKSESLKPKSKSSKNGLKSGLGLEYYKSDANQPTENENPYKSQNPSTCAFYKNQFGLKNPKPQKNWSTGLGFKKPGWFNVKKFKTRNPKEPNWVRFFEKNLGFVATMFCLYVDR